MRFSRRRLLASVPASALGVALASCGVNDEGSDVADGLRSLWSVPAAAWSRPIGIHPPGASGSAPAVGSHQIPVSRTKRGVPVGGIGTGSFMYNLAGSFGPWHMDPGGDDSADSHWGSPRNSGFEDRYLAQAAFHVRYGTAAGSTVQTLACEDVLPAWPRLAVGSGRYSALFPKAWFEYEDLALPTALKHLSPYVARDERRSSLPAGLFELAFSNPGTSPVQVSCMFTFPNAPYRLPTEQFAYTRTGLRTRAVSDGRLVGVRMQSQSADNVPQTEKSEWVIAASGPSGSVVTWTDDWAADSDGTDVFSLFAADGRLPDGPIDARRLGLAGAVAVSMELAPGAKKSVTFCLAWDFPVVQFPNPVDGTRWWRRYTQWYRGPYRAWDVARDVLRQAASIEKGIDSWWSPIADDEAYPLWLRTAALNELYYDVFGGVFWENGCITKPKTFGQGQNLYFTLESDNLRDCESFDVRHYEARHILQLFPTIERDVLLGWSQFIMADAEGRTPHDAGSPVDDPWFVPNQYSAASRGLAPRDVDWLDLPAKFVQQAHAYWRYTGDDDFAAAVYPAAQRTMAHLLAGDVDGDGIPDAHGYCTTYDALSMQGAAIYVAGLTIGACEAMADFAASFDSAQSRSDWQAAATLARSNTESTLWSAAHGYYRFDTEGPLSDTLMADALCGQLYADVYGLAGILDSERMAGHLALVHSRNVAGVAGGRLGAANVVRIEAGEPLPLQARAVWPGGSYFVAAVMYRLGTELGRPELRQWAFDTAHGVYVTTYENDDTAFWFDTPALWLAESPLRYRGPSYQRGRAVWELLAAVKDPFPPGWSPT